MSSFNSNDVGREEPVAPDLEDLIRRFDMKSHPEGGYYTEIYRHSTTLSPEVISSTGPRSLYTSIIYAMRVGDFSAFHRLSSDEIWYFHAGNPVEIFLLKPEGVQILLLGLSENEHLQQIIPANTWFAAAPAQKGRSSYSLVGCGVTPGFSFEDFELADRDSLIEQFPADTEIICRFTRA